MAPWSADDMKAKGARRRFAAAARVANGVLKDTGDEGKALRIALAYANKARRSYRVGTK